ncbi:efflux RND transporter periplasmic adaptor subunit [Sphingopyxis indica]|uniref:efflux RND transporter periplasmic adaptor subunit n=1 Tax=Sphingopyxis indica TaxID=436663 RepID=UPI0029393E9B|nr:efflux RND transporter periplasmic adaptor subunit [Sphingopyxis indica]WOF44955.1 efflux RND transporter periplasmic adaptor subunit [Sphingopyxis indica]
MFQPGLSRTTLILSFLWLAGCSVSEPPKAPPPDVGIVVLKSEPAVLTSELPGRIVAAETSEVRPQVNGVIRRRLFEEGAVVRAGQVLYEIEDAPYRAALGSARGGLARAQAAIDATRLQAERYRDLVGINAVSRQEADNARASAAQARADVTAQRAAVDAAQVNLGFTRVRAPITGRIGRSLFTPGALVQAGQAQPLATIQRTDTVFVDVTQAASEILDLRDAMRAGGLIRDHDSARVTLLLPNGKTYPLEGKLQFSEITADPSTGAVTLRATFPNPDGALLPGLYVRAQLVDGVRQQAILAPQQGVFRDERGRALALVVGPGNKVEQRTLTADRAIGNRWVITAGLRTGDRLIVEGRQRATLGEAVTPKSWTPSPKPSGAPAAPANSGK